MDNIFYYFGCVFAISNIWNYFTIRENIEDYNSSGKDFLNALIAGRLGGIVFMMQEMLSKCYQDSKKNSNITAQILGLLYALWIPVGIIWYDRAWFIVLISVLFLELIVVPLIKIYWLQKVFLIIFNTTQIALIVYILNTNFPIESIVKLI